MKDLYARAGLRGHRQLIKKRHNDKSAPIGSIHTIEREKISVEYKPHGVIKQSIDKYAQTSVSTHKVTSAITGPP